MLRIENSKTDRPGRITRTARQVIAIIGVGLSLGLGAHAENATFDYRTLATSKTSTMERELNEAAAQGYRFSRVVRGNVTNGGQVIIAMVKASTVPGTEVPRYKLLATTRTTTMQAEIQQLADAGYSYLDHTVFESAAGAKELAVVMELDSLKRDAPRSSYKLLATTRASTMQKELQEAGSQGYALLGLTAGKTGARGREVIAILRKER